MPCVKQTTKKYTSLAKRPGPPYKANDPACRGKIKTGNDGRKWKSTRNKNGVYTFKPLSSTIKKKSSNKKTTPKKKSSKTPKKKSSKKTTPKKKSSKTPKKKSSKTPKKKSSKKTTPKKKSAKKTTPKKKSAKTKKTCLKWKCEKWANANVAKEEDLADTLQELEKNIEKLVKTAKVKPGSKTPHPRAWVMRPKLKGHALLTTDDIIPGKYNLPGNTKIKNEETGQVETLKQLLKEGNIYRAIPEVHEYKYKGKDFNVILATYGGGSTRYYLPHTPRFTCRTYL